MLEPMPSGTTEGGEQHARADVAAVQRQAADLDILSDIDSHPPHEQLGQAARRSRQSDCSRHASLLVASACCRDETSSGGTFRRRSAPPMTLAKIGAAT